MLPAHWQLRNHDSKSALKRCSHQCINSRIRLTINQIVDITALVEDPAALKRLLNKILHFPIAGFSKLSVFNIQADDDVVFERSLVALLHVVHESVRGFKRGFVKEIVVVAERCRADDEDAEKKQDGNSSW